MGFGTDEQGVKAFTKSEALIGDLAQRYVASWLGEVIIVGAAFGAAACCLACVVGASRLIFALSRDGIGPKALAKVHETPKGAGRLRGRLRGDGSDGSSPGMGGVSHHTVQSVPGFSNRGHAVALRSVDHDVIALGLQAVDHRLSRRSAVYGVGRRRCGNRHRAAGRHRQRSQPSRRQRRVPTLAAVAPERLGYRCETPPNRDNA